MTPSGSPPSGIGVALAVLEEIARDGARLSANEIAARVGISRASAYRQLNALVREEYLLRHPEQPGFVLGARVLELAHLVGAPGSSPLRERADAARRELGEALHVTRFVGEHVVVVDEDRTHPIVSRSRMHDDLWSTAAGRLHLSGLSAETWRRMGLDVTAVDRLRAGIDAVGYAQLVRAGERSRSCIAIPLRDHHDAVIGAVALSTLTSDFDAVLHHLPRLRILATEIAPLATA